MHCHFSNDVKLLASDFDGTLMFDYITPVAKKDIQAIKNWQAKGNLFGIVSGRSPRQIFLNLKSDVIKQDFMIAHNGAMIFNKKNQLISEKYIDDDILEKIRLLVKQHKLQVVIFYNYNEGELVYLKKDHKKETGFQHYHNIVDKKFTKVHKISIEALDLETLDNFEKDLFQMLGSQVESHRNVGAYTEITACNVDKGIALEEVINYYTFDKKNGYTFGDSHNDYSMIKNYNGYTLPNGEKEIKDISLGIKKSIKELIESLI